MNHDCIKSRRRKSRESGGTICRGQEWGGFFSLPPPFSRRLFGFRGPWRRIKEFSLLSLYSLFLSLFIAPRISLPLNFFLSDSASPPPIVWIALRIAYRFSSVLFNLDHGDRGEPALPLELPPSRFLLLSLLSPLFETSRRVSFSREFAPIHNFFPPPVEKKNLAERRNALT